MDNFGRISTNNNLNRNDVVDEMVNCSICKKQIKGKVAYRNAKPFHKDCFYRKKKEEKFGVYLSGLLIKNKHIERK